MCYYAEKTQEIEKVYQAHGFSINNLIWDVTGTYNFRSLCHKAGFSKHQGYSITDIITLIFPLMQLNSVNAFYKSKFTKVTTMQKDPIFRLKNNERMPWRKLLTMF